MVCGRCGQPLGAKVIPLRRRRRWSVWLPELRGGRLWWLVVMLLLGLSGVLAALQIGEEQQRSLPRERRSLELRQRFS